jgi:hypothetical protein
MRRIAMSACALLLLGLPAGEATAGDVAGELVFCTGSDICRYFSQPRLEVTFQATPGERNNLRILPHADGLRIVDSGSAIVPGPSCTAVDPNDVRCGPPAPAGLLASAFTGNGPDAAFTRVGYVDLGPGRDLGIAVSASVRGGPASDELRAWGEGSLAYGDAGRDTLLAFGGDQYLSGGSGRDFISGGAGGDLITAGPGADQISGGHGRDEISAGAGRDFVRASDPDRDVVRCGRGNDRAFVSRRDRTSGCERVTFGWDR